ncbi:hypothetical protein [Rhizobium halophytocola]|uniref:Sulfotransferase family protein n=1 Tax=Rhizobium halophytocola TaxID=735519 RepID=A0ABS4DY99_9HYPH|nr:hypothetical protein [Rhizobium halophytocola]MBP1850655.1 hypothetical protein [Rhizobium halophytocola]
MEKPRVTAILSAWGTGSTAVTGYLDHCGAYSCPPHLHTTDPRTPNCYEPKQYRAALLEMIDENTLQFIGDTDKFIDFFAAWLPAQYAQAKAEGRDEIVLKHPLQALLLPVLDAIADCHYVVLTRSLDKIEETRVRRHWPASFGAAGAQVIYPVIQTYLTKNDKPFIRMAFEDFTRDRALRQELVAHARLAPTAEQLEAAEAFLR